MNAGINCMLQDSVVIRVNKDRLYHYPNIMSVNNDAQNDKFSWAERLAQSKDCISGYMIVGAIKYLIPVSFSSMTPIQDGMVPLMAHMSKMESMYGKLLYNTLTDLLIMLLEISQSYGEMIIFVENFHYHALPL